MGLEPVDFYSLRHSGATAKLRATGNIKALQGDMGHSSTDVLLNVYASIRDEDRRNIATKMDELWFSGKSENNGTYDLDETKLNERIFIVPEFVLGFCLKRRKTIILFSIF